MSNVNCGIAVHHDITLPAFPLALAWMDTVPNKDSASFPFLCRPFIVTVTQEQCEWIRGVAGLAEVASYVAVATFHPSIEIWNLDVIDPLEPTAVLGGFDDATGVSGAAKSKKKKGKKKGKASVCACVACGAWLVGLSVAVLGAKQAAAPALKEGSHMGAVLSLAWNRNFRQLLASGSDDNTVKLWDVHTQACIHTFTHHSQPVQYH